MSPDNRDNSLIERRYHQEADLYETAVEPVFRPAFEALLDLADLRPGERVLDVGAGPGLLALMAGKRVGPNGYVLGVDVAAGMVEVARKRAADLPQVDFERRDANALGLPDASFDAVLSTFSLQFTDPARSLKEAFRVLRAEGGRLAALLFGMNWGLSPEVRAAVRKARERYLSQEAIAWAHEIDASRERADARWAILAPDVLEARLRQLGFRGADYEPIDQDFVFEGPRALWDWHYAGSGLRRFTADWPPERRFAFHDDMAAAVASVLGEGRLTLSWEIIRLMAAK